MIPHHEQAVVMSQMVTKNQVSSGVADLAAKISQDQAGEIQQMQGFLVEWDVKLDSHAGHSMTGDMKRGMMTKEDLDILKNSSGADFEKMWLTMMLAHHDGAVTMATTVIDDGKDLRVKTLAENIVKTQQEEIILIRSLLGT